MSACVNDPTGPCDLCLGTVPWFPYSEDLTVNGIGGKAPVGYAIEYAQILCGYLGWHCCFYQPDHNGFGAKQPDGSWDGLLGDISRGLINATVPILTITEARGREFQYARLIDFGDLSFAMKNPENDLLNAEQRADVVVKVFDYSIWSIVLAFIVFFAICFSFICPVVDMEIKSNFKRFGLHFSRYLTYSLGFIAGRETHEVVVDDSRHYTWKAFYITWQLGAFLIALVYGAAMASSAVLPPTAPPFTSIEHLANMIHQGSMKMVFPTASIAYLAMMSDSRNPALQTIAQAIRLNPPAISGNRTIESWIMEGDLKTPIQYVGWRPRPIWEAVLLQKSCDVTLMDSFIYDPLTIALAQDDIELGRKINRGIEHLKRIAILEVLKLKYAAPAGCERQKLQESLDRLMKGGFQGTVNVNKIQWSLWLTLWGGLGSCFVFFIEARSQIFSHLLGFNIDGPKTDKPAAAAEQRMVYPKDEEEIEVTIGTKKKNSVLGGIEAWDNSFRPQFRR